MQNLNNVIRIHTDSVCFTKAQDLSKIKYIFLEGKTSGFLQWMPSTVNQKPTRYLEDNNSSDV